MKSSKISHLVALSLCCAPAMAQIARPDLLVWEWITPTEQNATSPTIPPPNTCGTPYLKRFTYVNAYNWGQDHPMTPAEAAVVAADDIMARRAATPGTDAYVGCVALRSRSRATDVGVPPRHQCSCVRGGVALVSL